MLFLLLLPFVNLSHCTYVISIYGNVYEDVEFFTRTFPWIVDNIGGEIMVDYYLLGSGRHTVPQMCTLYMLKQNTFLQAQYLQCEAEGKSSQYCICETGIDHYKFKQCVNNKGSLASFSSAKYHQLGLEVTPIVELGPRSTVFGVDDTWYLKKICTIFGDNLPRGCVKPFACNSTQVYSDRRGVSQIDSDCCKEYSNCYGLMTAAATTYTTLYWGTTEAT